MKNESEIRTPYAGQRPISRLAIAAFALAVAVALIALLAGLGSRWGLWTFRTGFTLVEWAVYGAIATVVLAAVAVFRARPGGPRRGFAFAFAALVVGLISVVIPWQARRAGVGVPPIHDITTDMDNPPAFVAVAPLRAEAPNPATYEGAEIARQQSEAYPDIRPVILDLPPDQAFQRALGVAEEQGWEMVDANPAEGRIEATDRTLWFGFRDDVVIRLTPLDGRTVLDIRSKSRVGRSDRGVNAKRIRAYIADVQS